MGAVIETYNPTTMAKPLGLYCHVARAKTSEFLHIAGQVSLDEAGQVDVDAPGVSYLEQCLHVDTGVSRVTDHVEGQDVSVRQAKRDQPVHAREHRSEDEFGVTEALEPREVVVVRVVDTARGAGGKTR